MSIYTYVCFSFLYIFWLGVLCEYFFLLIMSFLIVHMSVTPYVGFVDGASRSTQNLSSAAWVIYNPNGELINLQDIYLGRTKNNVSEYSAII